jgi:hypothetical protein
MACGPVAIDCGVDKKITRDFVAAAPGSNTLSQRTLRETKNSGKRKKYTVGEVYVINQQLFSISSPSGSGSGDH